MAEKGREIPDPWREDLRGLGFTAAEVSRVCGVGSDTVEDIMSGKSLTARRSTLVKITYGLPIDDLDKLEMLRKIGVGGLQRDFRAISVSWRGVIASFGQHADRLLSTILKTPAQFQAVADIELSHIEYTAQRVLILGS